MRNHVADAAAAAEARGNQLSEAAGDGSEVSVAFCTTDVFL